MMVATYNCGCPPSEKKHSCSPCCKPSEVDCRKIACCNKRVVKRKFEAPPPCCPTIALDRKDSIERPSKLRSMIVAKGLPYNEMEVTINNNRLVIRSQKEEVAPKYDPQCDCIDDDQPVARLIDDEIDQPAVPGTRTVTLYQQTRTQKIDDREVNETDVCPEERTFDQVVRTNDEAENPNIFVLRVKRKSNSGDKRFDIDLEFKTPRPWSTSKRTEYEMEWRKLESTIETDEVTEEEEDRATKRRKRKK